MTKQIDKRTTAERRDYFKNYHAARKLAGKIAPNLPKEVKQKIRTTQPPTLAEMRTAWAVRARYLEEVGQWPKRRALHPESLEETLRRVR